MAKKRKRKYSRSSGRDVESEMKTVQTRHRAKRARRKRRQGQKPQASNRNWPL